MSPQETPGEAIHTPTISPQTPTRLRRLVATYVVCAGVLVVDLKGRLSNPLEIAEHTVRRLRTTSTSFASAERCDQRRGLGEVDTDLDVNASIDRNHHRGDLDGVRRARVPRPGQ